MRSSLIRALLLTSCLIAPAVALAQGAVGVQRVPNRPANDNSTYPANIGYVDASAQVLLNALSGKAPLANPTFTGTATAPKLNLTGSGSTGDVSGMSVTAPDGLVSRTSAERARQNLSVEDFGAKGNCATDDASAFNSYTSYLRGLTGYQRFRSFNLGRNRCYIIKSSVNMTGLDNTVVNGNNSSIIGTAPGYAIIDAAQSTYLTFRDLALISSGTATTAGARVGIQVGRLNNGFSGGGSIQLDNVTIDGFYSLAAYFNRTAEVGINTNANITNRYSGATAYGVVNDGLAYFQATSLYQNDTLYGSNPNTSFNEQTWLGGSISNNGSGPAVWMANFRKHSYLNTFVGVSDGSPAAQIYTTASSVQKLLTWDVHAESPTISDIQITGTAAAPILEGLTYRNNTVMNTQYAIGIAGSVTSPTIHNFNLEIGEFLSASTKIFDAPSSYTVDGRYSLPVLGPWNLPATRFKGIGHTNGAVSFFGTLDNTVAFPSTLDLSTVTSTGSVTAITVAGGAGALNAYPGGTIPTISIAAPPSGGSQATAVASNAGLFNVSGSATGSLSGYTNNDVVTIASKYGCATPISFKAVVSGGTVTGLTPNGVIGNCPTSLMTNGAIDLTGGTGTGLQFVGSSSTMTWRIIAAAVTGGGSGYPVAPNVTFAASSLTATGSATLGSQLTVSSSKGQALFNASGTVLGLPGATGAPVLSTGALIDNSGVRTALGGSYTVPANTSLVRFTQASTVASSTVTLPTALADGQPIQFVNQGAGAVTALTFSPTVQGWTNGSQLNAGPGVGVRVRWDATASAWFREQ